MGMAKGPATREDYSRHRSDPCKGIAFVFYDKHGNLTLTETDRPAATLDLELWFAYLLKHGRNEIAGGVDAKLALCDDEPGEST